MSEWTLSPSPVRELGRIAELWRYPVKSMAGEPLTTAEVSWHGVVGDRRWAFVRSGQERSGFPWLTIREQPALSAYHPYFVDPSRPDDSAIMVRTPAGDELDVLDPHLAQQFGVGVRVMKQDVGIFDTSPLSVISLQAIASLQQEVSIELSTRRFRPNLVIDVPGAADFPEDLLLARVLRIGDLRIRIDRRNTRCMIVNFEPGTVRRDPQVLRAIARSRQVQLGVYAATVAVAQVSVGDRIMVED